MHEGGVPAALAPFDLELLAAPMTANDGGIETEDFYVLKEGQSVDRFSTTKSRA